MSGPPPRNFAQSLVPHPKVDQSSCILVRLSPGAAETAWLYARLVASLDGKTARELLAAIAKGCDVPRGDVALWKREEAVTLGFEYAMEANRFVALQEVIFNKLGIVRGTLRAHYLNEDDEPTYLVRVALPTLDASSDPDALAHQLLAVHFHFSRVAELAPIRLEPAFGLGSLPDSSVPAPQRMLASFSFRDEENLLQKLEMLRGQDAGKADTLEWEVVHIGQGPAPAVPLMFVFAAPAAQPVRRSPRRKSQGREAYTLENGFEGQSLSSEALAKLPQMERIGSPSTSQSSHSARGCRPANTAIPDDARSYASFQSTAFSVRSGFTYKPNEESDDRVGRSLSPSPGYEGGEHQEGWRQRLRARNG